MYPDQRLRSEGDSRHSALIASAHEGTGMNLVPMVSRVWPFANGSGRILDKFARGINLGSGEKIAQTSDGFPLHVYADDLIGRHLLMSGKFDRSIVRVLIDHAQPGDLLLDVGANIGYVSACFLANVEGSTVCCIEPQPGIVDLLRKNMAQFDDRAEVMQFGLADQDGILRFHVDDANRGASRISEEGETEIPVREARNVLKAMKKIDLLKIDVEGFEKVIFQSIAEELKRLKPRAILFEDQTGAAAPDGAIGSILAAAGYQLFGIDKRLFKTALIPIYSTTDCRFNDYLAKF